jgi:hypothetical protein
VASGPVTLLYSTTGSVLDVDPNDAYFTLYLGNLAALPKLAVSGLNHRESTV